MTMLKVMGVLYFVNIASMLIMASYISATLIGDYCREWKERREKEDRDGKA